MQIISIKEGFLGQKMLSLPKSTMSTLKENQLTKTFYISDLGHYPKASHHYRYRKKGSKQYIFIYCTKGRGRINLIFWLHFDGLLALKLYNRFIERNLNSFKNAPFSDSRIKIFSKIFELFQGSNHDAQLEYANLLSLSFISSFIYHDTELSTNDKNIPIRMSSFRSGKYWNYSLFLVKSEYKIDFLNQLNQKSLETNPIYKIKESM